MRWTRQRQACKGIAGQAYVACEHSPARWTNDACADGEVVWSWHPLLVPSWRRQSRPNRAQASLDPPTTVTIKNSLTGESTRETVKTIAQGRSGVPAYLW